MHLVSLHLYGETGLRTVKDPPRLALSSVQNRGKEESEPAELCSSEANRGQHGFFVASRNLDARTPLSL